MRTIYKYEVPVEGRSKLLLPKESVILSFQCQDGVPCIWAMVETAHTDEERRFRLFGTGHPIERIPKDGSLHYIGTAQQSPPVIARRLVRLTPPLVWHLFEEVES